jgi:hypothetical protein
MNKVKLNCDRESSSVIIIVIVCWIVCGGHTNQYYMITSCSHFFSHHDNRGVDFGGCGIAFEIVVANDNTVLLVELIIMKNLYFNAAFTVVGIQTNTI